MIRKVMADAIDVKAGLKIVLDKVESAFAARSKVSLAINYLYNLESGETFWRLGKLFGDYQK